YDGGAPRPPGRTERALMTFVTWLHDLGASALAGGKAVNLGELLRAGLPVPPGFVVTTDAYAGLISTAGIQAEIERLASVPAEDVAALEAASGAVAALLAGAAIPEAVEAEVREAYSRMGNPCVAVRSSAPAEG